MRSRRRSIVGIAAATITAAAVSAFMAPTTTAYLLDTETIEFSAQAGTWDIEDCDESRPVGRLCAPDQQTPKPGSPNPGQPAHSNPGKSADPNAGEPADPNPGKPKAAPVDETDAQPVTPTEEPTAAVEQPAGTDATTDTDATTAAGDPAASDTTD